MAQAVLTEERAEHPGGRAEYRLYLFAFYPLFLIAATLGRLVPQRRARRKHGTVFQEAAEMEHSIIPYIFSGR